MSESANIRFNNKFNTEKWELYKPPYSFDFLNQILFYLYVNKKMHFSHSDNPLYFSYDDQNLITIIKSKSI